MTENTFNLFALVEDEENPVRGIPLSRELQIEITDLFSGQINSFITNQHKVDFSGSYNAEEGEVFVVKSYPLDRNIIDAIDNPLKRNILDLREEKHRILALFAGGPFKKGYIVGFQSFDIRKVISKGLTIILSGRTYTKLEDPGITLNDKLTALYDNGELFFYSYHNTRHFLDLSNYYCAATDSDLKDFVSNRSLFVEDADLFMKNANMVIRRKVALLQKNRVLGKVAVNEIRTSAKKFGLNIKVKDGRKIVLPDDRNELINILRFLDEDYFNTVLTKRKCYASNKTYI